MSIRNLIFLFIFSLATTSQAQENPPLYIRVSPADIKLKLFRFDKASNMLHITFNIKTDFTLNGIKESTLLFDYVYPFEQNNYVWAAAQHLTRDLRKIKTIKIKSFTEKLVSPHGGSVFLKKTKIYLIVYKNGDPWFEQYAVTYTGPDLSDPHDLVPEHK